MTLRRRLVAAVATVTLAASGCASGSDDGDRAATRSALEQVVSERLAASPAEARCVVDYLIEDYSDAELRQFEDDGIEGLPQGAWESYFTSTIACLTQDGPGT